MGLHPKGRSLSNVQLILPTGSLAIRLPHDTDLALDPTSISTATILGTAKIAILLVFG